MLSGATEDGSYTGVFRRGARGTIDIIADILALCNSWNKRTRIMYKANLSYEQILYYLNQLLGKGLIAQDVSDGALVYRTTEKGREFLAYYSRMSDLITERYENASNIPLLTT